MGKLENKVAVITGAGSGIGAATAELFARERAKVIVADINAESGREVERKILGAGGAARFVETDATKGEDVRRMFDTAERELGGVDIVHNNAAAILIGKVGDLSDEDWDLSVVGGLRPYFLGTKYAIPHLKRRGGGVIINTASVAGLCADHGLGTHNTCKAGVIGLTRNAAIEYARDNIRVNAICPSATLSPPMQMLLSNPDAARAIETAHPLRRASEPTEQASVALFLASDEASYITGVAIPVDGGLMAHSGIQIHWDRLFQDSVE